MLSCPALLRMFVSRSASAREKHSKTPNLRGANSYSDGGTIRSEARHTISQVKNDQLIPAELVAHLRAENANQRESFAARLEAKDSQVGYSRASPSPRTCADTVLVMAYRSPDWKLMSAFDEMSCSVSAQASMFCSLSGPPR